MGMHNGPASMGRPHRRARAALDPPSGPCPYCGLPMVAGQKLDADHVIPRCFGGGAGPLRWTHASCNRSAGAELGLRLHARKRRDVKPERWLDRWA